MRYSRIATASMISLSTLSGCYYYDISNLQIVLNGFSENNYISLESYLDKNICVTGRLSVDSMGVYFPLQPIEKDGVISIGFSRINTGINRIHALRNGLKNNGVYTICGFLKDATPFKKCDTNHCRWYALSNAEPRRKVFGFKLQRP